MRCRLLACETQIGRFYDRNYDRHVADVELPLLAVADSECDDGTAGDIVLRTLSEAREDLRRAGEGSADALQEALVGTMLDAHRTIFRLHETDRHYGGGASATAISCAAGMAVVVHVGEGRLYAKESEGWVRKTTDHTLLEMMRAAGVAPKDAEQEAWYGGIVAAVLGLRPDPGLQVFQFPVAPSHCVLLCTPGAWRPLDPTGLAQPLPASLDGAGVARFVWDQYSAAGERDNATVLVAELAPAV